MSLPVQRPGIALALPLTGPAGPPLTDGGGNRRGTGGGTSTGPRAVSPFGNRGAAPLTRCRVGDDKGQPPVGMALGN
jgi:hypothetical protein